MAKPPKPGPLRLAEEELQIAEDAMLTAWRRYRDARELYQSLIEGLGPSSTEVALFVRRCAVELREAVERHAEAAQDAREVASRPVDGAK